MEPFFFIGYLIAIAISGLYQAMFMANAGGAWDNAKKIVEVELKQKGTPLHDATSSATRWAILQGHLVSGHESDHQVHHAVRIAGGGIGGSADRDQWAVFTHILAVVFFAISFFFVHRSFYGMRIVKGGK